MGRQTKLEPHQFVDRRHRNLCDRCDRWEADLSHAIWNEEQQPPPPTLTLDEAGDLRIRCLRTAYWGHRKEAGGWHHAPQGGPCQDECFEDIVDRWVRAILEGLRK